MKNRKRRTGKEEPEENSRKRRAEKEERKVF